MEMRLKTQTNPWKCLEKRHKIHGNVFKTRKQIPGNALKNAKKSREMQIHGNAFKNVKNQCTCLRKTQKVHGHALKNAKQSIERPLKT